MNNIQTITKYEDNSQSQEQNRFETCEDIVEDIIDQGILNSNLPVSILVSKIAQNYGITTREARSCLNLAQKQDKGTEVEQKDENKEELYSNCGYYYPEAKKSKDGMSSLSSLGSYNRLMFGLGR